MKTITPNAEIGTAKKIATAIAGNTESLAQTVADAKLALETAKSNFADAEIAFLATGLDGVVLDDGRKVTVVRSTVRDIDSDVVKDGVSRGVWQRITSTVISTKAFDLEVEGGRIEQDVVDSAVTVKDRKPSVRVK